MSIYAYRRSGVVLFASLICALSSVSAGLSEQAPTTPSSCQDFSQTLQKASEKHGAPDMAYFPVFSESSKADLSAGIGGASDISTSLGRTSGIEELDVFKVSKTYFAQVAYRDQGQVIEVYGHSGSKVSTITVSKILADAMKDANIQGIIAHGDKLVVVSNVWSSMPMLDTAMSRIAPSPYQSESQVAIFDMSDAGSPKRLKTFKISASIQNAYITNDQLTLVTQGMNGYDFANKKYTLPRITEQMADKKEQTRAIDCGSYSFFSGALESRSIPMVTSVLTQSLSRLDERVVDSGFVGVPNIVYFTGDHMYVSLMKDRSYTPKCTIGTCPPVATYYGSDLYAFTQKDGAFELTARTMIPGQVNSAYSLQRYKDSLVVLSQESPNWELIEGTRLSIYDPTTLKRISTLPRIAPGEMLGGVRFDDTSMYFITYRNVDPVFKIDLSNIKKPKLLGALKIPGFSNILLKYDQHYLVSVGMDSKEIKDADGNVVGVEVGGVKVDLYDVSKDTPVVAASRVFGGTGSQLHAYDMKQILFDSKTGLLTIPVSLSATGSQDAFVGALNLTISPQDIALKHMFRTDTEAELKTWFETRCGDQVYPDPDERPVWCTRGFDAQDLRKKRFMHYSYEFAPSNLIRTGNTYYLRGYDRMWKVDTSSAKDEAIVDAVRVP